MNRTIVPCFTGWLEPSDIAGCDIGKQGASWQDEARIKFTDKESADIPDLGAYRRGMRIYASTCQSLLTNQLQNQAGYNCMSPRPVTWVTHHSFIQLTDWHLQPGSSVQSQHTPRAI